MRGQQCPRAGLHPPCCFLIHARIGPTATATGGCSSTGVVYHLNQDRQRKEQTTIIYGAGREAIEPGERVPPLHCTQAPTTPHTRKPTHPPPHTRTSNPTPQPSQRPNPTHLHSPQLVQDLLQLVLLLAEPHHHLLNEVDVRMRVNLCSLSHFLWSPITT